MSTTNNDLVNAPTTSVDRFDNPLLPHQGVPVTQDDFVDSTERVINATGANIVRDPLNKNIWDIDPSVFYSDSNLDANKNDPNKFNLGRFNKEFDRNIELSKQNQKIADTAKLSKLAETNDKTSLHKLPIQQILINTKNSWFDLLDDILARKFILSTLTKNNRLFYIGLTLLFITVIMYLYFMIIDNNKINNKYNIHSLPPYPYSYPHPYSQSQPFIYQYPIHYYPVHCHPKTSKKS